MWWVLELTVLTSVHMQCVRTCVTMKGACTAHAYCDAVYAKSCIVAEPVTAPIVEVVKAPELLLGGHYSANLLACPRITALHNGSPLGGTVVEQTLEVSPHVLTCVAPMC